MISAGSGTFKHKRLRDVTTPHSIVDTMFNGSGEGYFFNGTNGRMERRGSGDSATALTDYGYDLANTRVYLSHGAAAQSGAYICDVRRLYWNLQGNIQQSAAGAGIICDVGFKFYDKSGAADTEQCSIQQTVATIYFNSYAAAVLTQSNLAGDFTAKTAVKIHWYDNAGTNTVKYYTGGALRATHTANVPTTSIRPYISSSGNAASIIYLDSLAYAPGSAP